MPMPQASRAILVPVVLLKPSHRLRRADLCCGVVLVDQSTDARFAAGPVGSGREGDHVRVITGCPQHHPFAWVTPSMVVVIDVSFQENTEVAFTDDQHPVG